MRKPITRRWTKPPTCDLCNEAIETVATPQNPSATIRANNLARCPACMVLVVVGADLRPSSDLSEEEAAFKEAMNASPEVREWALKTLETALIRRAVEFKAECVAAHEWLIARSYPDLEDDLAVLDAYACGFDETGKTSALPAIRFRASNILAQMFSQTGHRTSHPADPVARARTGRSAQSRVKAPPADGDA